MLSIVCIKSMPRESREGDDIAAVRSTVCVIASEAFLPCLGPHCLCPLEYHRPMMSDELRLRRKAIRMRKILLKEAERKRWARQAQ